jgi:asparagine synthase (glutamine-hydrolysing)
VDRPRLYADYEHYLRTDLRRWAEALLFESRTRDRGLFNPAAVQQLWERHLSGRELWTIGKIAPLMTIEQTIRYLIDDEPAAIAAVPPSVG